jgi:hypothetical protein
MPQLRQQDLGDNLFLSSMSTYIPTYLVDISCPDLLSRGQCYDYYFWPDLFYEKNGFFLKSCATYDYFVCTYSCFCVEFAKLSHFMAKNIFQTTASNPNCFKYVLRLFMTFLLLDAESFYPLSLRFGQRLSGSCLCFWKVLNEILFCVLQNL